MKRSTRRRLCEIVSLSPEEQKRWTAAFKPMIERQVVAGEKAGLPARGLVSAYGLVG